MRKLLLSLGAAVLIAVVGARAAAADGPMFVTQDGTGTGTANGSLRYVAVNTTSGHGTDLVEVSRKGGSVGPALRLSGAWGLPYTSAGAEGVSRNGRTLVLGLDTVGRAAYCIDLPKNHALYNLVLTLRDHGRTLAVHWRSGRPWLQVAVGSWRISYPGGGFPWGWIGAAIGGALALLAAAGLLLRRRRGEKLEQDAGQELGLA